MATKELTKKEAKWMERVEKLMLQVPDRFGLWISGDMRINVFDKYAVVGDIQDGNRGLDDESLGSIETSEGIHGLAM